MRKRQLLIDNERLKAEVGYLRGQIQELQKAPGNVLAAAEAIVSRTLAVAFPETPATPAPGDPLAEMAPDWTDGVAGVSDEDLNGLTILEQDGRDSWAVEDLDVGGDGSGG